MKWLLTSPELENRAFHQYLDWVGGAGVAIEVIRPSLPLPLAEDFNALLLTGGVDIDPTRYGQASHLQPSGVQRDRDSMEFRLLERFIQLRRAVLGICRGLQAVQVFLGGRLIQHIPDLVSLEEERHSRNGSQDATHRLSWQGTTPMTRVLGGRATECNSAHHQAADPYALATGLTVAATSACGIVEALESPAENGSFISCVQWHLERMKLDDPASGGLRAYWVEQVRRRTAPLPQE